jgi:hypothetical protein
MLSPYAGTYASFKGNNSMRVLFARWPSERELDTAHRACDTDRALLKQQWEPQLHFVRRRNIHFLFWVSELHRMREKYLGCSLVAVRAIRGVHELQPVPWRGVCELAWCTRGMALRVSR